MPTNSDKWYVGPIPVSKGFMGETQVYPVGGGSQTGYGGLRYVVQKLYQPLAVTYTQNFDQPIWTGTITSVSSPLWSPAPSGLPTGTGFIRTQSMSYVTYNYTSIAMSSAQKDALAERLNEAPTKHLEGFVSDIDEDTTALGDLVAHNLVKSDAMSARLTYGEPDYGNRFVYSFGSVSSKRPSDPRYSTFESGTKPADSNARIFWLLAVDEPLPDYPATKAEARALFWEQVERGILTRDGEIVDG